MEFTYVDLAAGLLVLVSAYLAYVRGLTREILAIAGWIVAALAAFYLAPAVKPLLEAAPVIDSFLASNCVISMIASFVLVMAVALLVLSVFTPIFSSIVMESALGPVDRAAGFLFGAARGVLLVAVAFLIHSGVPDVPGPDGNPTIIGGALGGRDAEGLIRFEPLRNAAGRPLIETVGAEMAALLPDEGNLSLKAQESGIGGWFSGRLDALMAPCQDTGNTPTGA